MTKHASVRERTDDLNLLSYSRVAVPESSATNADKIFDPATATADCTYYTFEAATFVTIAEDQAEANSNIDDNDERKKMQANEYGYWNKDEIPDGKSVWAQADADASSFVNLEHRQEKSL